MLENHQLPLSYATSDQLEGPQESNSVNLSKLYKLRFTKKSTKIVWLIHFLRDLLKNKPGEKVIVVSQFVEVILKINEALRNARIHFQTCKFICMFMHFIPWLLIYISFVTDHGSMNVHSRKVALESFNRGSRSNVLVMSLKCGGVGLNLQRANYMVIMDRWWNPATIDQLTSRIHRMTQYKKSHIYTVVIKDTIEETLMDRILAER